MTAKKNLLVYNLEDGNDVVTGFDGNDTLRIGDGTGGYYAKTSGDDLIVQVGAGTVTLKGAANLKTVNIAGTLTDAETESNRATAVTLVNMALKRTDLNYPVLAGIAFDPTASYGPEPTNYSEKETWTIKSSDGLKLNGVHYAPENSGDKWAILIHGYGLDHKCMYPFATFYLDNGYNVLLIDQRAAGTSEGTWLTMGTAESADIALWTQEIASRFPESKITLHGVSMGAATAMLAASRSDIANVTSFVEDCGYSDIMKVVVKIGENVPILGSMLSEEVLTLMDSSSKTLTDYYLSSATPIDSIGSAKMPSLFITGTADSVISPAMLDELYDASGASLKEKFLVAGAGHAMAASLDSVGYSNTLFRFVAEANEEGWTTDNIFDNIYLKGTSYDDNFTNSGELVTISGGKGDDQINLSTSAAVISYADGDGNDNVVGFGEDSTLKVAGDYKLSKGKKNVVVKVGDGKVTLRGAATLDTLNIVNTKLTLTNKDKSPVTAADDVEIIDASSRTKKIKITGNKLDNQILGGSGKDSLYGGAGADTLLGGKGDDKLYGGAGNDTLDGGDGNDRLLGGKGNDTLYGSDGSDTFVYTANTGKDYIMDFTGSDLLKILNADGSRISFTNSSFKNDKLTLAIDGGGHVIFSGVSATDTFNINGTTYSISGTKLK
ncbi:MAG: alpha/beta hydrolase [Selenomonadaceae bacterium]|nr:alpha/beta hydrolase [Selenomonadaceae bacterium]MBQ3726433.1 alpha/beta hydrolase [Selenomonadaceae bacterium]MBQ9497150.1 alpha/beta hydrolase [Selenomonadaceae bacterium]